MKISPMESGLANVDRNISEYAVIGFTPLIDMNAPKITSAPPMATTHRPVARSIRSDRRGPDGSSGASGAAGVGGSVTAVMTPPPATNRPRRPPAPGPHH